MDKKSVIIAIVLGAILGIFILHPLWMSIHAVDGQHDTDISWLDFVVQAYRSTFTFKELGATLLSIFVGTTISIFVLMFNKRKGRKFLNKKNEPLK